MNSSDRELGATGMKKKIKLFDGPHGRKHYHVFHCSINVLASCLKRCEMVHRGHLYMQTKIMIRECNTCESFSHANIGPLNLRS